MSNREKAIASRLERWEREFRAGENEKALEAISFCLQFEYPVPWWAANHFCDGVVRYTQGADRTLDEAFRVHRPRDWNKSQSEERQVKNLHAFFQAKHLVRKKAKVLDAFEEVGSRFNLSPKTISKLFYDKGLNARYKKFLEKLEEEDRKSTEASKRETGEGS